MRGRRFYQVQIPFEQTSRGTGEQVELTNAVIYDFMPRIVGDRFRAVPELRMKTHFYGDVGPFLEREDKYRAQAEEHLQRGDITKALEAYKRSLHAATGFITAMAMIQRRVLLSAAELERLNLEGSFGGIENELMYRIVSQDIAFDLPTYISWLKRVRQLENDAKRLNQIYFFGAKDLPHEDMPKMKDPETGRRLRDTYAEMRRFSNAGWISGEIGDPLGVIANYGKSLFEEELDGQWRRNHNLFMLLVQAHNIGDQASIDKFMQYAVENEGELERPFEQSILTDGRSDRPVPVEMRIALAREFSKHKDVDWKTITDSTWLKRATYLAIAKGLEFDPKESEREK